MTPSVNMYAHTSLAPERLKEFYSYLDLSIYPSQVDSQ
jgi:hypothetical protein